MHDASQDHLRRRLQSLQEIASAVNSRLDLTSILQAIIDAVCQHTRWSMGGIMIVDLEEGYSILAARHDPEGNRHNGASPRWELKSSPARVAALEKRPIIIYDAQNNSEYPGYRDDARARGYHTVVILPLHAHDLQGRPMVLSVQAKHHLEVTDDELSFLETVVHQVSIAVQNAHLLHSERDLVARLQRTLAVHSRLLDQTLSNASLSTVLDTIQISLSKPLTVVDATSNVITPGRSPDPALVSDQEWATFVAQRANGVLLDLVQSAERSDFRTTRTVDFSPLGLPLVSECIVEPLVIDDEPVGGMIVFAGSDGFDELDLLFANEAKFALSVCLLRSFVAFQSEANLQADLLSRLFSGDWRDREEIIARAGYLGIRIAEPTVLVTLAPANPPGLQASPQPSLEPRSVHRWLARTADYLWPGTKVVVDNSEFVAVVPVGDGSQRVRQLGQSLVRELSRLTGSPSVAAVSSICETLDDYPNARQECSRIITFCRQFGKDGVVAQSDLGPYGLLFSIADGQSVKEFVTETMGALEDYDRKQGSTLVETLEVFLRNSCRFQRTAEDLSIHVSTLRYRLDRIREVSGLDLEDPDTRFKAELALRLRALYDPRTSG